jgi:hypothetical protein
MGEGSTGAGGRGAGSGGRGWMTGGSVPGACASAVALLARIASQASVERLLTR